MELLGTIVIALCIWSFLSGYSGCDCACGKEEKVFDDECPFFD